MTPATATPTLPYVQHVNLSTPATHSIIWLHGLGDTGNGWLGAVQQLKLTASTRFVLPHAPTRAITLNQGYEMPGWYDLVSLDFDKRADTQGIEESITQIHQLIDIEIKRGIPSRNIILVGFSQGGAVALHAALRYNQPLGGLLALSTYLPMHETLREKAHSANRSLPIAFMHGTFDNVVPLAAAQQAYTYLQSMHYTPTWNTYPMAHEANFEELQDIQTWINQRLVR